MKKLFSLLTLALLTLSVGAANTYVKVTSADQLEAGKKYILVNEDNNAALGAISGTSTPYGTKVDIAISNGVVDIEGTAVVELTLGTYNSSWTFDMGNSSDHHYLVWTSGNSLNTATGLGTANTNWTASTTDDGVVLTNGADNTRKLQYNQGSPRFACYTSAQKPAILYVQQAAVTVAAPTLPAAQNFEESLEVTITNNEDGATLYYSTDGLTWTPYTQPLVLTETTTVYAKASKDGVDSPVVSTTYTKVEPTPEGVIVFVPATDKGNGSTNRGEWTVVKDGITMHCSDGTVYDENYRIYKNATISFTSTVGNIVKIEFDGTSGYPVSGFGENAGLNFDGDNGTWEGNAATVTLTVNTSQVRATEIRVYVDDEAPITVMAPTFDPADGYTFTTETLDVTINCATPGANIVYVVNNGDEVEAAAPVTVTLTETSTITAYAELDGVESEQVEATYTKEDAYTVGGVATFVAGVDNDPNVEYRVEADLTIVKDNVTMKYHGTQYNYYNVGAEGDTTWTYTYRIYKNQNLQFTSTAGNIRKIEFNCEESNPITGFDAVEGLNMETATWEGKARQVTFTANSKQVRCYTITVTLDDDTSTPVVEVADPVITPASNTAFTNELEVTITCETEGAEIYFGYDNENFEQYRGPFTIDETCTVYAYAQVGDVKSATVSAKYYKAIEVGTIAEANALDNKTEFTYTGEAVVTYQWKNTKTGYISTWIKDASGYGLIYGKQVPELTTGDVLTDCWSAQKTMYNNSIPEFQYPSNVTANGDHVTVEPVEMAAVDTVDVNKYIIMKAQTLTAQEGDETGLNFVNTDSLVFYNQFGVVLPAFEEGKTYDVVGIVTIYKKAAEVYIISATEVAAQEWLPGDVNHDNIVDVSDVTATISVALGGTPDIFYEAEADLNGDGIIDVSDVTAVIARALAN